MGQSLTERVEQLETEVDELYKGVELLTRIARELKTRVDNLENVNKILTGRD